jgi:hypothetical protein
MNAKTTRRICQIFHIKRQIVMSLASLVPFNSAHYDMRIAGL